ncbi:conserved hypothetical protein [Haloferula helveola]|uniref:FAD/FMN-containing dehydrogenase n=1 Tax=Haloferula helveola TaxID=490095 RepID=A0ABN6H0J4_9BACT|nr:conserved hypothetical protein [Haloferula helveola]
MLALLFAAFALVPCLADPYAAGEKIAAFSAKDQHKKDFTLDTKGTRFLLVSHDMDTGKAANAVLTTLGAHYLPGKKAVYMANIHGMPGVGRMFALPKMKKYAHRIILGDDAALIAKFPEQQGKVTVLKLSGGKISSIKYWNPASEGIDAYLK